MSTEDFEDLKKQYKDGDVCVTNARGFWEKAPRNVELWCNVGEHIIIKEKDVSILNEVLKNKDIAIEFSHYKNAITFPIENEKFITSYSANCFYSFQAKNADRHNTISEIEDEAVENKRVNKPRRCK